MSETMLNTLAQDYLDLTLSKSRYDEIDIQWFTESPFWRRTSMRYSREYKILPDYEIGDLKHGKSLRDILDESENLIGLLKAYRATAQEQELARIDYIIDHVTSVHVRAQLLSGQTMSYDEMTDGLYGLVAPEYDPKPMQDLLSDLQQVLPGSGSVQEKIAAFRSRITVPTEHLLQVLTGATQFFHDETVQHMHVTGNSMPRVRVRALADPRSDFLSILFGYDYNHLEYERNFNTLVRWSADKIVECIGHEMEPGHLTYYEKRTQAMIDTCWPEMAVVSQYSPSSAFTEGSARVIIDTCFENSMAKKIDFERAYIFEPAGLDVQLLELMPLWHRYMETAGYAKLEATRQLWNNVWTAKQAAAELRSCGALAPDASDDDALHLAGDDGHFVAHDYARDVIRSYFARHCKTVQDEWDLYERLCSAHMSMRRMKEQPDVVQV